MSAPGNAPGSSAGTSAGRSAGGRRTAELAERYGVHLPVERSRARLTAYVYGNILVLAALGTASPESVEDGHAAVVVLATTVTTYLAHIVSHAVGHAVGLDRSAPRVRGEGLEELRDALPIVSSGSLPVALLVLAWATPLGGGTAVLLGGLACVVRLAGVGVVVARVSGLPPSGRQVLAGLLVAAVSGVIVVLKVWLTH